ncbi:MAG: MarR family EPS-associated transcriptional regulator [Proteobacteria bacterium]|nr:MarR family EPS-associated transcriptional regulator [Pseudomonadota bacterium]
MTNSRQAMREDAKARVLRLLADNPEITQRELSQAVGISTGSVHYLLNALLETGLIKFGNFSASKDKRRYAYILTPQGIAQKADLTRRFLARKREEYENLSREIAALEDELADSSAGRKAKGLTK